MTATYASRRVQKRLAAESRLRVFRDDIQGIRGLAILMVVIHHMGFAVYGGVDISFILSGYLATDGMLRAGDREQSFTTRWYVTEFVPKYYARRARRVIPLSAIVIFATMIAALVLAPAHKLWSIGWDGVWAAVSATNYRLAIEGTNYLSKNAQEMSPLQHYWSLAVEEQFYLIFPWVFLGLYWVGRRLGKVRTVLFVGLVLVGAASLYASIVASVPPVTAEPKFGEESAQPWAYFPLHTRAWELLIGCLVAVLARQFARMWLPFAAALSWGGLVVIAVGSVMIGQSTQVPGSVMLWPTIGAAMFIAGGCANPWYGAELLFGTPQRAQKAWPILARVVPATLQYLGRVSYGWYLWHWAPLILLEQAAGRHLTLAEKMTIVVLTLALAIVTNMLVETPIKQTKHFVEVPKAAFLLGWRFCIAALLAGVVVLAPNYAAAQSKPTVAPVNPAYIPKLLQESVGVTQLPASAEKQMSFIKNDLFPGCIVDVPETRAESCSLGDTQGDRQIVLFGNSLAWHLIPAVNKYAKESNANLTVIAKAGCPPEDYDINVLDDSRSLQDYSECTPWRKNAYNKIDQLKPQLVIMSSRAEDKITPKAVRDAVARFKRQGAEVVMVLETPYAEFGENDDVPNCIDRNRASLQNCITKLPPRPQSAMVARVAKLAGATVIDPTEWLCYNGACPSVIDGKVVYWDDHHLTATMMMWLSDAFIGKLSHLKFSKK